MDRFLVPKSKYRLTPTYNVFSISHNLKHGPRKQTFQSKVQYKYKARIDLLKKNTDPTRFRDGYPKDKAGAIDLIRRVHGTDSITVGPPDTFDGTHKKTGSDRVRCNICVDYPQPMLRATHKKEAEGIFSAAGRPWKLQKVVSHFVGKPHYEALSASRAHDLKLHLALHPEENVNNYTQNVLERACAERKQTIYETRIKHVGMVYTDMKCLTLSSNSFPARDLVDSYCDHLLELKDDDFKPFIPTPDDCRYNNPTAHKRYRTMLSDDITEHFVKPLFANVLAASVAYDGWRAFHELYIHGSRLVFKDGTIKHVFIALVDPTGGGAAGCVESFNLAYKRVFDDETTFNDFMECVVCQTSDGAAVNTGAEAGANVTIRTDIIKNPNLPELICDTHCGHNAWKDWLKAFDVIYRVITQHNAFVSFTHRGDIMKDFRDYTRDTIYKDHPKDDQYYPKRLPKGGTTRMASHAFNGMYDAHEGVDCWLLFLDHRSTHGRDSTVRFTAIDHFSRLVNFKKLRNHYLVMDLMRHYTIFDKAGQIVGIGILELYECKNQVINAMKQMQHQYGEFETNFYVTMLTHDNNGHYVYDYGLTHIDNVHMDIIEALKSSVLDTVTKSNGDKHLILPISDQDKQRCSWLNLRHDIIQYFIDRINDRCLRHDVVKYVKLFDPKVWRTQYGILSATEFMDCFAHDAVKKLIEYWPRINETQCKIGLVTVKQIFIDVFMTTEKLTLTVFGQFIVNKFQYNEINNVKINGPPINQYDGRRVAAAATMKSRTVSIDVKKHTEQPYLKVFFHETKQSRDEKLQEMESLRQFKIANKNIQNMKPLIKRNKSKSKRVRARQNTDRYQANITAYMLHYQAQQTAQREVFNHKNLVTMILTQLVEEQGETARSIFHLRLINKAWNEAMKTQRLRREYMSIACYFNVSKDDAEEYVCCFSDKEEELYHRVIGQTICDRSWMLLSVNDMLLFCKSMFQERMSKNDIRQKMMDYYHVTYNTVKNDYRCRLALKIFKSRIESDDYY
eukprot:636562_1